MSKWVKPQIAKGGSSGEGSTWRDSEFGRHYPCLLSWMGEGLDDEGHGRATGTLLVFCEGLSVKACVRDRETDSVAFVTAATFQGLLEAVEEGLRDGGLDWRANAVKPPARK